MTAPSDRSAAARSVADAVCYEGYVLYPYRASSRKNQARWQFGVLVPPAFAQAERSERSFMRTECLARCDPGARLTVRIRCLQVQHRDVEVAADGGFIATDMLEIGGARHVSWDEAVDQVVDLGPLAFAALADEVHEQPFVLAAGRDTEMVSDTAGCPVAGRLVRRREQIEGVVRLSAVPADGSGSLTKVVVSVENTTGWAGPCTHRDDVIGLSLVAVHTMLAIDGGSFVSLLEVTPDSADAVAGCRNDGAFPVLIGDDDVVLSSPIILYDHPAIAPESPGDLYDATEIDEILALRVLTLTDEEKSEARGTDPRSAAIIDRCDGMDPDQWDRLHGTMRPLETVRSSETVGRLESVGPLETVRPLEPVAADDPAAPWWDPAGDAAVDPWTDSVVIAGVEVTKGSPVRLQPSHRADAQDIFLRGLTATVAGVFSDVDGSQHVAVTVDDDPATAELVWQGRYLFFHPDEVEPLSVPGGTP